MKDNVTLYIATHNITGKKYFGKTIKWFTEMDLQEKYHGSGKYWLKHLAKHGDDVKMEIYKICSLNESDEDYVKPIALQFSYENNIVKSDDWANLKLEDGFEGGSIAGELHPCFGTNISQEHKDAISVAHTGKIVSTETREKLATLRKGKPLSEETKEKLSIINTGEKNHFYGKKHTEETKEKLRGPKTNEHKEKLKDSLLTNFPVRECPHCKLVGSGTAMNRYHFDNCKNKEEK